MNWAICIQRKVDFSSWKIFSVFNLWICRIYQNYRPILWIHDGFQALKGGFLRDFEVDCLLWFAVQGNECHIPFRLETWFTVVFQNLSWFATDFHTNGSFITRMEMKNVSDNKLGIVISAKIDTKVNSTILLVKSSWEIYAIWVWSVYAKIWSQNVLYSLINKTTGTHL